MGGILKITSKKFVIILLFFAVIFYPLLFITHGVDLTDSGFSIANSIQIFTFPERTPGSIWLSNFLGGLWGSLFGFSLLSFRIFGSFLIVLSSLVMFFTLNRKIPPLWLLSSLLLSEMLLRRFIVVGSYNQVSILFICVSYGLLINGLKPRKCYLIVLAGMAFGLAFYARLPNIVFALPLSAFLVLFGVLHHQKLSRILADLGYAILGTFLSIGICFLFLYLLGKGDWYIGALFSTFATGATNATSHGFLSMANTIAKDHIKTFPLTISVFGGITVCSLCFYLLSRKKIFKNFDLNLLIAGAIAIIAIFIFQKPITLKTYDSLTMVFLQSTALILLVSSIAFSFLKSELRLQAIIGFLFIIVLPFGTNNGLRYAVNGAVLFIPTLFAILVEIGSCFIAIKGKTSEKNSTQNVVSRAFIPLCVAFMLALPGIASFAFTYVYRDASRNELKAELEIPGIKKQKTTIERAEELNKLYTGIRPFLTDEEFLLAYGAIPLLHVITEIPTALDSPWPDLEDYLKEMMEDGLNRCIKEKNFPFILIAKTNTRRATWPLKAELMDRSKDDKYLLLINFLQEYNYTIVFEDTHFIAYERIKG